MSKAIYNCKNCNKKFTGKTADRKRGWAQFCSKSCASRLRKSKYENDHNKLIRLDRNNDLFDLAILDKKQ